MLKFNLSENFIDQYKNKRPDWGPLGEIIYLRTYSRVIDEENRNERWWETIRRVIEGTFSIQKEHCSFLRLPWNNTKAQRSAQIMFEKMFNFKFLPSGRGLWMMGSKFVEERGNASPLLNCAFISSSDIETRGSFVFIWAMDALLLGVGVGFDTKGANKITIKEPKKSEGLKFQIPDSREGWVESLELLLDAFFYGKKLPEFDYSIIRPYGSPIRGFGGVASGSGPLIEMHKNIRLLLETKVGEQLKSVDIVDIMNMIATCVVAGNIRRSAELALGEVTDEEYIKMKDPKLFSEKLKTHRWASNNSVFVEVGKTDYKKFVNSINLNGEPGFVWIDNIRKFGRMADLPDNKDRFVLGLNPCITGETLVAVADGRGAVSIKQLAEEGLDVPVYSVNSAGMVEIKMGRNPRITGYNENIVKVTLDDNSIIKATPNHKFRLIDGSIVEAKDLKEKMSLTRFTKYVEKIKKDGKDYIRVLTNTLDGTKNKIFEHRLIVKFNNEEKWNEKYDENKKNGWIDGGVVVHHKDYNGLNNFPDNLEIMTFGEHTKYHGDIDNSGEKNGMFGRKHSLETKNLIAKKTIERCSNPEYIKKLSNSIRQSFVDNPYLRKNLSKLRKDAYNIWCKNFIASTDLETLFIDGLLYVKKNCENCGKEIVLSIVNREVSYCSNVCSNTAEKAITKRKVGLNKFFAEKQENVLHNQIIVYKDLQEKFNREPWKKEWEAECRLRNVPFRIRTEEIGNKYCLKSYRDLKERANVYNHRVKNIEFLEEKETVYNITVDDNHTIAIFTNYNNFIGNGIFTFQCGEIPLESGEMCNLVETFPSRHETFEEYKETLKYAYLYAKTVTLIPTQWPETNAVMMRNRRIGTSMSGIIDAFIKHGRRKMLEWCDKGYKYLRELDEIYSNWLCIPKSIKITTTKPSGSVSLLPGVSPGIHYPHSEYYIRRVRIASGSPLIKSLKDAGYHIEVSVYGSNEEEKNKTLVVSFPIHEKFFNRRKRDVTIWEQVKNAVDLQRFWSDNSVSITVTFNPEEKNQISSVLEAYEDSLKAISFLPLEEENYEQLPYEEITKEQYEEMTKDLKIPDFSQINSKPTGEIYCSNDGICEIPKN